MTEYQLEHMAETVCESDLLKCQFCSKSAECIEKKNIFSLAQWKIYARVSAGPKRM